jgi:hypothetical protein
MLLVDTNIWLEGLLEQEKAEEAKSFFEKIDPARIFITEFSIHSIGILTIDHNRLELFEKFLSDVVNHPEINKIRLENTELELVSKACKTLHLDFDDAYQYVAAKKYGLTLVSFDADFDRTDRGRKTPGQIIK